MMRALHILVAFTVLLALSDSCRGRKKAADSYVREACSVTRYQDLCVHSLASFSRVAGRSPSKWARAGVAVTVGEAKNVTHYLYTLKRSKKMKGKNKVALSDCIDCFEDAIGHLHMSLGVLRNLESSEFDRQMEDLTTWMSSVLTDEDTCMDGLDDRNNDLVKMVHNRVSRVTYITSNALALVNKLAATGLDGLSDP